MYKNVVFTISLLLFSSTLFGAGSGADEPNTFMIHNIGKKAVIVSQYEFNAILGPNWIPINTIQPQENLEVLGSSRLQIKTTDNKSSLITAPNNQYKSFSVCTCHPHYPLSDQEVLRLLPHP